jgi:NADPH:quinone reductase-like Zn-dependent oxidoreductase
MKTWRIEEHGGPEVLKQVKIAEPVPGPMEVLVQVEAVGLNHLDLWVRNGVEGHHFPLPLTPGCDIAGKIEKMGAGAEKALASDRLTVGSSVIINPGTSCGHCEACLGGFDPLCRNYGIFGETQNGGCTEMIAVPVANLIARPYTISAEEGAALGISFLTAWTMLTTKAQIKTGEIVLIQAGGSGVSVAAIQIAKLLGATVITTVGSKDKIVKAKALGADYVINYKNQNFRDEVKKILKSLDKKGCEVVLDHVGTETFAESMKCLAWGGRIVTCGATSGSKIEIDLKAVFFKNISILGSTMGSKSDLIKIVKLVSQGKLKPIIDTVYEMSDLPNAFAQIAERKVFGKVILRAGASQS